MTILTAQPISSSLNYLLSNVIWQMTPGTPLTLTYDFLQQAPTTLLPSYTGDPAENSGWAPFTSAEQAMAVQALSAISSVANVTLQPSTNEATSDILFGTNNQTSSAAYTAYGPGSYVSDGRYLLQQTHVEINNDAGLTTIQFIHAFLHEMANSTGLEDFVVEPSVPASINSLSYAVESYYASGGNLYDTYALGGNQPVTPQILDILAWQHLYGANQNGFTPSEIGMTETHIGNNHTYAFNVQTPLVTVWIGTNVSGVNCFDFSHCSQPVVIDLTPGTLSSTGINFPGSIALDPSHNNQQVDVSNLPYQNVGIAFGTTIQVGIAVNNYSATLYGDATPGHNNLLMGGIGIDTFIAGGGTDICISKWSGDFAEFHDPYADYKITTGLGGGLVITDQAAKPADGTMILVGGFSSLAFSDQTISLQGSKNLSAPVVDTAANLSAQLDSVEGYIAGGYTHQIALTDSGVPTISLTAAQLVSDATALSAITTPYALSVEAGTGSVSVTGAGNGTATTLLLPDPVGDYKIDVTPTGFLALADGSVLDTVSNVTALQFSDTTVFVASSTPALTGGVSSAQIVSLYSAVLGREPDAAGLAFYQNSVATNSSLGLVQYAEFFLSSAEYQGNTAHSYVQSSDGDAQFITDIYQNLLHRAPDSGAVPFYQKVVASFTDGLTPGTAAYASAQLQGHAQVLVYYSVSPEFIGDVRITAQHPADAQHWLYLT